MNIMKSPRLIFLGFCFAIAITQLSGCTALMMLVATATKKDKGKELKVLESQVESHEKAENFERLDERCKKRNPYHPPMGKEATSYRKLKRRACASAAKLKIKRFLNVSMCEQIIPKFKQTKDYASKLRGMELKMKDYVNFLHRGGAKLAKCGQWDYLLKELLPYTTNARELLPALDKVGISVDKVLISWMKKQSSPFSFDGGSNSADRVTDFFVKKKNKGFYCRRLLTIAKKSSSKIRGYFNYYFSVAKCRSAIPYLIPQLSNKNPYRREQVCYILGKLGTRRLLSKLRVLARTDPAWKWEGREKKHRIFFVRESCRAAVGKIRLRSK